MAFDHKYPYTDFHELNLDWVLDKITGLDNRLNTIEENITDLQGDIQRIDETINNISSFIDDLLDADQEILGMIASEYNEETQYDPDFLVRYEGKIYKCKPGQTPGPFDSDYWEETDLGTELGNLLYTYYVSLLPHIADIDDNITELYKLYDIIGEEYDPDTTYHAGDMCYNEGVEYICTATGIGTTGPFDPTKWSAQNINTRLRYIEVNTGMIVGIRNMIAADYDSSATYAAGDYILHNEKMYRALQTVPAGYDPQLYPAYWTEVTIGGELKNVRNTANSAYFEKMTFTLTAGNTQIAGVAPLSGANSALLVFTSIFGVNPTNISEALGIFTIDFPAQAVDMDVLVFAYPTD